MTNSNSKDLISPQIEEVKAFNLIPVPQGKDSSFKSYTFASALKLRERIQPELSLQQSMSKSFLPVNPFEAKVTITRTIQYEPEKPINTLERSQNSQSILNSFTQQNISIPFKRTSPSPAIVNKERHCLNSSNRFNTFLTNEVEQPRLNVLHNFKEISRIMTNNFLKNKELEVKYRKQSIPKEELSKKLIQDEATQKMTLIMKKMGSPRNFTSPIKKNILNKPSYSSVSRVSSISPLNLTATRDIPVQRDREFNSIRDGINRPLLGKDQGYSYLPQVKQNLNKLNNSSIV